MNLRLFVAAELPEDVRAALAAWRPDDPALRAVDTAGVHVTLCFLGWVDETRVDAVGAAATACAAPVGELAVREGLWLPPRRPRVLTIALDDPDGRLGAVQQAVVEAMVGAAGYVPEKRPFLAHVTVARVRRGGRAPRGELPGPPALGFTPAALILNRSHMRREGATYEALVSAPLR